VSQQLHDRPSGRLGQRHKNLVAMINHSVDYCSSPQLLQGQPTGRSAPVQLPDAGVRLLFRAHLGEDLDGAFQVCHGVVAMTGRVQQHRQVVVQGRLVT
jgi:hypothetical protein